MSPFQSVDSNHANALLKPDDFKSENVIGDPDVSGNAISKPEVISVTSNPSFFNNGEARKIHPVLKHSAPAYKEPTSAAMTDARVMISVTAGDELQNEQSAGRGEVNNGDKYSSFISLPFRQNPQIILLFANTEKVYREKNFPLLCNQFAVNIRVLFDEIQSDFLKENKSELEFMEAKCRKFSAELDVTQGSPDEAKGAKVAGQVFKSYGGRIGNDYFDMYSQRVAIKTLSKLLNAVTLAYKGSSDPDIKQLIVEELPFLLTEKAGAMRGDIAHKNTGEHFGSRENVPFGKLSGDRLSDAVNKYPGWLNLIFPQLKRILLDAFVQASNGSDSLKINDKRFISALTGNSEYRIKVDYVNHKFFDYCKNTFYLCEISGLEGSMSGEFLVELNESFISKGKLENLQSQDVFVSCIHRPGHISSLTEPIETILSWGESDGVENLKDRLWNFLAFMSGSSFFARGQAAIVEWLVSAFAKAHKYNLVFSDAWLADGERLNLTPDLRALSAFDNNAGMLEFRAQVGLIADTQ